MNQNIINFNTKQVIEQLEDLREHCDEMQCEYQDVWTMDVEALNNAIKIIKACDNIVKEFRSRCIWKGDCKKCLSRTCTINVEMKAIYNILNRYLSDDDK